MQRMEVLVEFDHIGIMTTEKKPDEMYVPATKVWVTRFADHPYHVEWLRFEQDRNSWSIRRSRSC